MDNKLYHHKTGGGAEYLTDTFIPWKHRGKSGKEGTFTDKTSIVIRIDGDITKDAEYNIREENLQLHKLTSLSPNKYKKMKLDTLADQYVIYCNMCSDQAKSFTDWLNTEI